MTRGDLLQQVADWIEKSGYPLEARVGDILRSRDWHVRHSQYFVDLDSAKGREIDVVAYQAVQVGQRLCTWDLVIECKKSKNPWVVFSTDRDASEDHLWALRNYDTKYDLSHDPTDIVRRLHTRIPFEDAESHGIVVAEAFGDGASPYDAIIKAVKASLAMVTQAMPYTSSQLQHVVPVVVLDAPLLEYRVSQGTPSLAAIPTQTIRVNYRSPNYDAGDLFLDSFPVQLVTLPELERWIDFVSRRFRAHWGSFVGDSDASLNRFLAPYHPRVAR